MPIQLNPKDMAKKKKYYVVWIGHSPGIYQTWQECKNQVEGFPNAMYKSFANFEEAKDAYDHGPEWKPMASKPPTSISHFENPAIEKNSICVDAACSGNPGQLEYRAVWTKTGTEAFRQGPFEGGTNNVGEFLAIVHACALLSKTGDNKTTIYSDSKTAMKWVKDRKANTKLKKTGQNRMVFELIRRAEEWLIKNPIRNELRKWDTKNWGEIPADFGRK